MALWTDIVEPAELTVFARQSFDEAEAAKGSLSVFFPNVTVPDVVVRYTKADNGLTPVAQYRAYDAESSIGSQRGGQRVTIDLPPVSQKNRIGELDMIRDRALTTNIDFMRRSIATEAVKTVTAISGRIELQRAEILETGRVTIAENGFHMDADLGRSAENNVTAAKLWSDPTAGVLDEILAWVEHYTDVNGMTPGSIVMSRKAFNALKKVDEVRGYVSTVNPPSRASSTDVNSWLVDNDLPAVTVFDRKVQVGSTTRRLLSEDKVFFLPAAGTSILGQTTFGIAAEAGDPAYSIAAADQAGILTAAMREEDPYGFWVRSTAIALPVMTNPDASMVAKVL